MAAKWSFGTVGIFVSDDALARDVYRAELKVLNATTNVLQYFGAGSRKHAIRGLVIGQANMEQLETWAINNTSQTFTSDQGSQGSYKINGSVKAERMKFAGGVIDGTSYTVATPIYNVELELISTA